MKNKIIILLATVLVLSFVTFKATTWYVDSKIKNLQSSRVVVEAGLLNEIREINEKIDTLDNHVRYLTSRVDGVNSQVSGVKRELEAVDNEVRHFEKKVNRDLDKKSNGFTFKFPWQ